jgi:hypothetical protein
MARNGKREVKKHPQLAPHGKPLKKTPAIRADSKLARLVALLRRPRGASLESLMSETGWQAHSVRGAIAGAVKKKLGLRVESDRVEGARVYRIVDAH